MGAPAAGSGLPAVRARRAVSAQLAIGRHRHRPGFKPPVDEVEVVGGLVDQQRAALFAKPVPAAEVVRPVVGVQHTSGNRPRYLADFAGHREISFICAPVGEKR